ncbi:lys-63-specific deubiquitinase BRCC36 isoform X3 [Lepidochelys kempii]|uniref:lys-63-specific deubiquitinase BRCC36 isoform X3 n=1 Tax=Lepidochelys kempii TaxID=8472 RepID=UPI003C6F1A3F
MAVQAVHLEADAFLVCLNHALSTEKEEVMGLCIGEVPAGPRAGGLPEPGRWVDTSRIVHIHSVIILRRSDKRKDRVEISPEQLSAASTEAERLAEITGRSMRVVGWYHSHPHITVWPSHVDVRTQAMYQMMDQGFVGLIFSCFIEDKNTKPHPSRLCNQDSQWLSVHQESLQPNVCYQWSPPTVAGGQTGAEQTAGAGTAARERRAHERTSCPGVKRQPQTLLKKKK